MNSRSVAIHLKTKVPDDAVGFVLGVPTLHATWLNGWFLSIVSRAKKELGEILVCLKGPA